MRTSLTLLAVALLLAATAARGQSNLPNITAAYECDSNCTAASCVPASIPQNTCFYVAPAKSYVVYECINNNTEVRLKAYGPLKFMCSPHDPLHLTFTYPVDTCVLPKAGGYTKYHCH